MRECRPAVRPSLGIQVGSGLLILLALGAGLTLHHPAIAQTAGPAWRDTGLAIPGDFCFDATRPHVIVVGQPPDNIVAYNWVTGAQTRLDGLPYRYCNHSDSQEPAEVLPNEQRTAGRFFLPDGPANSLRITYAAQDDTSLAYAFTPAGGRSYDPSLLHASSDGGRTWELRSSPELQGQATSLAAADEDARVLYASVVTADPTSKYDANYAIYYSSDTGRTWAPRYRGQARRIPTPGDTLNPFVKLEPVPNAPADTVMISISDSPAGSSAYTTLRVSQNGGRTFQLVGRQALREDVQVVYTQDSLVRLSYDTVQPVLQSLSHGDDYWKPLPNPLPPRPPSDPRNATLGVARPAPANLFLNQGLGQVWYSPDSGHTWQAFAAAATQPQATIYVSPYLPLTLLEVRDGRLQVLDLPDAGRSLLRPVVPSGSPDGQFFAATGHNLAGAFGAYWAAHGGLAQQGYPLTEAHREIAADGNVYQLQYFERAVFEYHPENAPPYDVLLSLLGVAAYGQRYGPAGAPGQHVNPANALLFSETGHTVGGAFRAYWEAHGGVA